MNINLKIIPYLLIIALLNSCIELEISAPSFIDIASYFDVSAAMVGATITYNLLGFSLASILYGPLSESIGYKNKGELGMPFRIYMSKGSPQHTHHLHIWEIGNPEIEKHLLFRDYLINNSTDREQYAELKFSLAQQYKDAHRTYTTLKDAFIKGLVAKTGFNGLTVVQALHDNEWQEYHRIRKQQIFDPLPHIKYDPKHPTLADPNHYHFVMMKGIDVVAVAQIEMFDEETAVLRIIATDSPHQGHGYGRYFLNLLERWAAQHGRAKILMHAASRAERFYRGQGYVEMEFNDQGISDDHVDLGKLLN